MGIVSAIACALMFVTVDVRLGGFVDPFIGTGWGVVIGLFGGALVGWLCAAANEPTWESLDKRPTLAWWTGAKDVDEVQGSRARGRSSDRRFGLLGNPLS